MPDLGWFALFIGMGGALIALVAGPIGQAVGRRIAGGKSSVGVTTGEMTAERAAEIEQRLADLETAQARIAELEERLDFAERLLARGPAERADMAEERRTP